MKNFSVSIIISVLIFSTACRNRKLNTTPVELVQTEVLDTIHITAKKVPIEKIYRASNTLVNDIVHTRLDVRFDWEKARMNGTATLSVRPYFYPVETLALNARGMEIKMVEVYEVAKAIESEASDREKRQNAQQVLRKIEDASFQYRNDTLKIRLGKEFTRHDEYAVVVEYVARPGELPSAGGSAAITEDKGLYFINPHGKNPFKMPQIWTQGETQANSVWFPTVDSPNEKMTQEIFITVDEKYTTLSNGILVNSEKRAGGMRTDHWKLDQPHAPYLAMMAVGEFVKVTDLPWNGKEVSYYVEKEYAEHAKAIFSETRDMIDFYSRRLEVPYPWDKYAQVVTRDYVSGAMENTSATLHGDFMVYQTTREIEDGRKGTAVIAHELFHQWFGDLVTCESWSNLPLNESFATYGEYLWYEHRYGRDAADQHLWQSKMGYIHARKEENMIRFYYDDKEDMFDAISYNKGGQVMHMLRKAVGDEAFFHALKKYLNDNMFQPVEIHHLRLAFEQITGRDMNWFFNQWFLNKGRPKLRVVQNYDSLRGVVNIIVEQQQDIENFPLYQLPVDVDIYTNGQPLRQRILISARLDTFTIAVPGRPGLVNFDAERQLLADIEYSKEQDALRFQYANAPLFADRLEALQQLSETVSDSTGFYLFSKAARRDPNAELRKMCLGKLENSPETFAVELKRLFTEVYQNDTVNRVRAFALASLNKRFRDDVEVMKLTRDALSDRSYAVIAEALEALAKTNPAEAIKACRSLESEKGKDIIFGIATIYAAHGADEQLSFFRNTFKFVSGFDMLPFCAAYAKTIVRAHDTGKAVAAAEDLGKISTAADKYTRYAVIRALKDILKKYEEREADLQQKLVSPETETAGRSDAERRLRDTSRARAAIKLIYERAAAA